jgi:hypothetical protein
MKHILTALAVLSPLIAPAQRGPDRAPKLDAPIPAVSAKSADGKNNIELSKPKRLTVLIFGSHT